METSCSSETLVTCHQINGCRNPEDKDLIITDIHIGNVQKNNAGPFLGFKRPERSTDHSLLSRSEVKNAWKFTVISPELLALVLGQIGKCLLLFF
jgi:hypothetical protein